MILLKATAPRRKGQFKFLNLWVDQPNFMDLIQENWWNQAHGNPMQRLSANLKRVKVALKGMHRQNTYNITQRVVQAKANWDRAQMELDQNQSSETVRTMERHCALVYAQLARDEESFFKQRSRVQWLELGDKNTAFFHRSLKHRQTRNRVDELVDEDGRCITNPQEIGKMAAAYFKSILNAPIPDDDHSPHPRLFAQRISEGTAEIANKPFTDEDIKQAIFSIPDNKSPGPDGFTSCFFKRTWQITGASFTEAIRYFLTTHHLPRCFNAARIVCVPKVESPTTMNDFRPISCCTVIYKTIAKLLASRLKEALSEVVGTNQSAFLPGRNIADAILLTQELMRNYHLNKGQPRCALKVDLRKAFDTVRWDYIMMAMSEIGLPRDLMNMIKMCITNPYFTVCMNGENHGFFSASRGLRQGDPLSPYLFVLAMEGLNGVMDRAANSQGFKYHWRCKETRITHVSFADDLMMFSRADEGSVTTLKTALEQFSHISGLNINNRKSSLYMAGIEGDLRHRLRIMLGFETPSLPVTYLGVPLISTRLKAVDCQPLIERITTRIRLWTSATLSYAGRLQLIKSVLFAMQVYWSSKFIIPEATVNRIESILKGFLWKGPTMERGSAKVAWHDICRPLDEGGLGIKSLHCWNRAAIMKLIWELQCQTKSKWAEWVRCHLLKGKSLWQLRIPSNPSWTWRKILQLREHCRNLFMVKIGNGERTSIWFDNWLKGGKRPIDILPYRQLTNSGIPGNAKVAHIINGNLWRFPEGGSNLQEVWRQVPDRPNPNKQDQVQWQPNPKGKFTVASAWNQIRNSSPTSNHLLLPWLKGHIPRHSFILWIAMQRRLKTMDRLHGPAGPSNVTCVLCNREPETHCHLFFNCSFSKQVWEAVNFKARIQWPGLPWDQLTIWAGNNLNKKSQINCQIARLVLAASVYHMWREQNRRVFSNQRQGRGYIAEEIFQVIRTHLSCMASNFIPVQIKGIWGL